MALKLITPAAVGPVTLAEAKLHLRVETDVTDEDALISALVLAATQAAEQHLLGAVMQQTWERVLDAFPCGAIELGMPPVSSITSIKYLPASGGADVTLSGSAYTLDADGPPGWALPAVGTAWPATLDAANTVRVRFACGYANAAEVPAGIKQWVLVNVGHWYRNREAASDKPLTALPHLDGLLQPFRSYHF